MIRFLLSRDLSIKWLVMSVSARCQVLNTLLEMFHFLGVSIFGPRFCYNTFLVSKRMIDYIGPAEATVKDVGRMKSFPHMKVFSA